MTTGDDFETARLDFAVVLRFDRVRSLRQPQQEDRPLRRQVHDCLTRDPRASCVAMTISSIALRIWNDVSLDGDASSADGCNARQCATYMAG